MTSSLFISSLQGGFNSLDEKPAFHPGELESCDDADSDLLLLVLEAEGHTSVERMTRAYLGNTQYLATIPVSTLATCSISPPFL